MADNMKTTESRLAMNHKRPTKLDNLQSNDQRLPTRRAKLRVAGALGALATYGIVGFFFSGWYVPLMAAVVGGWLGFKLMVPVLDAFDTISDLRRVSAEVMEQSLSDNWENMSTFVETSPLTVGGTSGDCGCIPKERGIREKNFADVFLSGDVRHLFYCDCQGVISYKDREMKSFRFMESLFADIGCDGLTTYLNTYNNSLN